MHPLLLHNSQIREASDSVLAPGQVGLLNGWGVFSTLRVIDGVLFSYERHFARMSKDARLLRVPFPSSADWLEEYLYRLVEANQAWNATLRVSIVRNKGGMFEGPGIETDFDLIAFTKNLKNWGESTSLEVVPKTRHADHPFAGTKMLSWSFNLVLLERANERGFDEIVMLNERGEVSECTSANIFAVFGSQVLTPPISSGCLPGITRAILLEEVRIPDVELREKPLLPGDLEKADEVFVTSSTRDLLPVRHIEGLTLKQNSARPVTLSLLNAYRSYMNEYAASHRRVVTSI